MNLPLVVFGLAGCAEPAPPPTCVPVADLAALGAGPSVWVEIDGRPALLFWDTGWSELTLFTGRLPEVRPSGEPALFAGIWGQPSQRVPLQPVELRLGDRVGRVETVERLVEPIGLERLGFDGFLGRNVLAALGAEATFASPDQLCVRGEPCRGADQLWTTTHSLDAELDTLVDTGIRDSLLLDSAAGSSVLRVPGAGSVGARLPPRDIINRDFARGVSTEHHTDAVLGWDDLRTLDWRWQLCDEVVDFDTAAP